MSKRYSAANSTRNNKPAMQFTAPQIAERHGFTARHWTRLAARGIIPGARQPSGPGGHWLFDYAEFKKWWDAARRISRSINGLRGRRIVL